MHVADREISLSHFPGQPLHLFPLVTEDDGLGDREGVIEVTQGLKFVLVSFDSHEELFDAFQSQLIAFDEDFDWPLHELVCHLKDLLGQRG